ncbi:MAG: fumarylacetoacetate hydrolase family protein [Acidobacteria bacterium]|nr:fumarylacetoacetate hydrolase family protein [Acidobacteriota bacterium]
MTTRRTFQTAGLGAAVLASAVSSALAAPTPGTKRFVRFRAQGQIAHGLVEGEDVRVIQGDILGNYKVTATKRKVGEVKLLYPIVPPKVLAVGLNYKSHIGNRTPPSQPEMFYKPITCLQNPEEPIRIPTGAKNVHYEGELVIVIGKRLNAASKDEARAGIFGATCGNDVSERDWQNGAKKDLQWWRAKGADTFGPMGPAIVSGLNYDKLLLETRLNGKSVQKQNTSDLLFDCTSIVSFVSQYVTLTPGDVIYTGTPGATQKMSPGDVVEVEIEGIGILRNAVIA